MKKTNVKKAIVVGGIALISIVAIFCICKHSTTKNNPPENEYAQPVAMFYTEDGQPFAQENLTWEYYPLPKKDIPELPGKVFTGWDKDIRSLTPDNNVQITAKYIDISDDVNVIAMPATYGILNKSVSIPLKVMGQVDICGMDAVLSYDNKVIEYVDCEETDESVSVENDKEAGLLYVRFVSGQNAAGEIDLSTLNFKILNSDTVETDIKILVKDIIKLNNNNEIENSDYGVVDAKIHLFPDGGLKELGDAYEQ